MSLLSSRYPGCPVAGCRRKPLPAYGFSMWEPRPCWLHRLAGRMPRIIDTRTRAERAASVKVCSPERCVGPGDPVPEVFGFHESEPRRAHSILHRWDER